MKEGHKSIDRANTYLAIIHLKAEVYKDFDDMVATSAEQVRETSTLSLLMAESHGFDLMLYENGSPEIIGAKLKPGMTLGVFPKEGDVRDGWAITTTTDAGPEAVAYLLARFLVQTDFELLFKVNDNEPTCSNA